MQSVSSVAPFAAGNPFILRVILCISWPPLLPQAITYLFWQKSVQSVSFVAISPGGGYPKLILVFFLKIATFVGF